MPNLALKKDGIRLAYSVIVERLARLVAFANHYEIATDKDINDRQISLCIDDLIVFSINARRLLFDTQQMKAAFGINVPLIEFRPYSPHREIEIIESNSAIPITRILNIILHHNFIEIYRTKYRIHRIFYLEHIQQKNIMDLWHFQDALGSGPIN